MTNDLRYRGLVTVRNASNGHQVAECRTSKSYSTGFRALNEAETLSEGYQSEIQTTDIAVECVKAVSVCGECNQLHTGNIEKCSLCGSGKMWFGEMEVMF